MNDPKQQTWLAWLNSYIVPPLILNEGHHSLVSILERSRKRIVGTLYRSVVLFGFLTFLAITPAAIKAQFWASLAIGWGVWLVFLFFTLYPAGSYKVRSALFLIGAYLFVLISHQEQASGNQLFLVGLFVLIILSFVLLGNWWGIFSVLFSLPVLAQFYSPILFSVLPGEDTIFFWLSEVYAPWLFYAAITIPPIVIVLLDLQTAWGLERDAAEALLRERNKLQESVLREQALRQELERALHREIELNGQKSKIINTISHEFRTPLAIINQSTELLATFSGQLSEAKKARHREAIEAQIFYLDYLMRNIYVVNADSEQRVVNEQTYVSMQELVERLENKWGQGAAEVAVLFEAPETAVLMQLDSKLYYQVMDHLIANAVNCSNPPATVSVQLSLDEHQLTTAVKDEGIGVLPEEKEAIFELFQRGSNIEYRRGLGLGLFIAKKITETLQGDLYVMSAGANEGSKFVFCVPVRTQ